METSQRTPPLRAGYDAAGAGEVASKGSVRKIVDAVVGPAVGAVVAVLLATPLDSGGTLAVMFVKALPALALGVAAGVATIFAARLLTFVVWKVLPSFRTRSTKLRGLAPEIRELRGFETPTGPDALPLVSDYHLRCDELIAKLEKLGIPAPTREQFVILRSFLAVLYDCAIRGDVEKAKGVLTEVEPEVDALRDAADAAKLQVLAQEIEDLYHYDVNRLADGIRADDLFISRYLQRRTELGAKLSKLGIPSPEGEERVLVLWQTFLYDLYGYARQGDVKEARGLLERLEAADQKPAADGT